MLLMFLSSSKTFHGSPLPTEEKPNFTWCPRLPLPTRACFVASAAPAIPPSRQHPLLLADSLDVLSAGLWPVLLPLLGMPFI